MRTEVYENGQASSGGNGDRISNQTLFRWIGGAAITLLTIFFTRWLNSVDSDIADLKRTVTEQGKSQARIETKIDLLLPKRVSAGKESEITH